MSPRPQQKDPRRRRRIEVRYTDGLRPPRIGYSGNVSARGMMIRTPQVLPPGSVLTIDLRIPGNPLRLQGVVVWAREGPFSWLQTGRVGMGVRFIDPPAEIETLLASGVLPTAPAGADETPGDDPREDDPDGPAAGGNPSRDDGGEAA